MGLFGKKSRGPTIPISEYSENALKRYRPWLLDHYETKAEIALQSNEGWELMDADRRDRAFPRADMVSETFARIAAIGHRAAFTDLRDRRYKHLTVLMADRPYVDEVFITGLEPLCLAKLQHKHPSLNMDLFRYFLAAPHYRPYTWEKLGPYR